MRDVLYGLGGIALLLVFLVWLAVRAGKTYVGPWNIYGVCPCGYKEVAPFGDLFHIHKEICPKCATPKNRWSLKTLRWSGPKNEYEEKE